MRGFVVRGLVAAAAIAVAAGVKGWSVRDGLEALSTGLAFLAVLLFLAEIERVKREGRKP